MPLPQPQISRRKFVTRAAAAAGVGLAVAARPDSLVAASAAVPDWAATRRLEPHQAWVWRFDVDGDPTEIRDTLAERGMAVVVKTHDGTSWQSRYDNSDHAIGGPADVERLARFFEDGRVPFHAWAVVHGKDPVAEAAFASSVLSAGARSLSIDLEPYAGFWLGSNDDADRYGAELRRLQPGARVVTSIDPRPWALDHVPLDQFAAFSDALAPQTYWGLFGSSGNVRRYREWGDDPGPDGITARFMMDATRRWLAPYNLPIYPIGDGTIRREAEWWDFYHAAQSDPLVGVWRYGIAAPGVLRLVHTLGARAQRSR